MYFCCYIVQIYSIYLAVKILDNSLDVLVLLDKVHGSFGSYAPDRVAVIATQQDAKVDKLKQEFIDWNLVNN